MQCHFRLSLSLPLRGHSDNILRIFEILELFQVLCGVQAVALLLAGFYLLRDLDVRDVLLLRGNPDLTLSFDLNNALADGVRLSPYPDPRPRRTRCLYSGGMLEAVHTEEIKRVLHTEPGAPSPAGRTHLSRLSCLC